MTVLDSLDPLARHWAAAAMQWTDQYWDEEAGLLWGVSHRAPGRVHLVRNTVWYATGLLMRGDNERAYRAIETLLLYQFDEPEAVYHGTFKRAPQEPNPPADPTEWRDYDPNWREFICTTLIMIMIEFELPDDLQEKIWVAIRKASEGAYARKVAAEYTNIALMSAFLLDHAGAKLDVAEWRDHGEKLAKEIFELFSLNNAYWEYNSPTYYGVDLFALVLWRKYGLTDTFTELGTQMEAAFWRDLVKFYHAGLRNQCGPYDRSYGMDMTKYLAVLGLWIGMVVPPEKAPLPDPEQPFEHEHDFHFMPPIALLGASIPDDVQPHLEAFQGERYVERTIESDRRATAWLSEGLMLGAETEHPTRLPNNQFHPATAHWQLPDGQVGWLRLRCDDPVSVLAEPHRLRITCVEDRHLSFEVFAGEPTQTAVQGAQWAFPGVNVRVMLNDTDTITPEVTLDGDTHVISFDAPAGIVEMNFATSER